MARSRKTSTPRAPCPELDRLLLGTKRAAPRRRKSAEPDLIMLLGEPEVRLLMRADNVDERELVAMLDAVSVQLRSSSAAGSDGPRGEPLRDAKDEALYRPGVGIMLLNARNEVFVGRRADTQADAWQMPQGGIDSEESPRQAALRELKEEIGTASVEVLAESNRWLYYDVPEQLAQNAWRSRWKGQRQKWFVMLFRGTDAEINVCTKHPEFNAWRWVSARELTELAVSFKRQLYLSLLGEFSTIFRD
jgi:8-oxo-dGTP pyrophosphatase MutT (NUDIX family)